MVRKGDGLLELLLHFYNLSSVFDLLTVDQTHISGSNTSPVIASFLGGNRTIFKNIKKKGKKSINQYAVENIVSILWKNRYINRYIEIYLKHCSEIWYSG